MLLHYAAVGADQGKLPIRQARGLSCYGLFRHDGAIDKGQAPIHSLSKIKVMGHGNNRLAILIHSRAKDLENLLPRLRVERGSRLVGKDDGRIVGERTSHRHALPLSTRKLVRQPRGTITKANRGQRSIRSPVGASYCDRRSVQARQRRSAMLDARPAAQRATGGTISHWASGDRPMLNEPRGKTGIDGA